jgi:Uma2 family endonuclease
MQLTINLPERETTLATTRQLWAEVLMDRWCNEYEGRIETNAVGQIVATPVMHAAHAIRQSRIAKKLGKLLSGHPLPVCPVITADGVKAIDACWMSQERYEKARGQEALELAPEICADVVCRDRTEYEIKYRRHLYFDAGANECWQCDLEGRMTYYTADAPNESKAVFPMCPEFPSIIEE